MIVSKLSRSRNLVCCNRLLQQLIRNDPSKVGLWFSMGRMFISSTQRLSRSTPSLAQLNFGLSNTGSSNGSTSLINDEHWPNLLFTDDTWSEVDGDEKFNRLAHTTWDSPESEEIPTRSFSSLRLFSSPKHRAYIVKVISEELDLNDEQANRYFNLLRIKPILNNYDEMKFIRERRNLLRLLKKHLHKSDIIDAFGLFTLSLRMAQFRISFLKECGFKTLKPIHLLQFDKIQCLSEATAKHLRLLDPNVCVVDTLLSQLPNLNESSQLRECLTIQGLTIGQQYEKVIFHLLKKIENSAQIWKSKHLIRYITIKGINVLSNALKDFSLKDSYSSSDMRTLFEVDPNNLEEIISQIPKQFDQNTLIILLKYPKILQTHPSTLLGNLHLLKHDYGFTNSDIDNYPKCLMVETKDLKERIDNLYSKFGISTESRSILSLIHLDLVEVSAIMKEMKDNGFIVTDVSSVYDYHEITVKKVKYPEVIPSHLRGLNRELDVPQSIIVQTLHRHPNFRSTDNHNIKKTYQYIKNLEGITNEQLLNGLNLCLYDLPKIDEAINSMKKRDDYEEWREHPFFLEALVYTIEKIHSYDDVLITDDQESNIDDFNDDQERP